MDEKWQSLVRSVGVYSITNVVNAAIPFLLLPILTNHISPASYGILAMFQVLTSFVLPFIGINAESTASRFFFDKDLDSFEKLLGSGIRLIIITSIFALIITWILGGFLENITEFPSEWMWTIVIFAFGKKLIELLLTMYRVTDKALHFGLVRILSTLCDLGLSVLFVVSLDMDWEGRVWGQLLTVTVFGLFCLWLLFSVFKAETKRSKHHRNVILDFGIPLIPHALGAVIITYSDRVFITNMIDLDATGLYATGYQIGMVIFILQNSFNQAWSPWFFHQLNQNSPEIKKRIVKITYFYSFLLIGLSFAIIPALPLLFEVLGSEYANAMAFVFWIAFAFALNGIYKMFVNYLFYLKSTRIIGTVTSIAAFLNIILNYIFIKEFGAIGAAYATVIAFGFQMIMVMIFAIRKYEMPWLTAFSK